MRCVTVPRLFLAFKLILTFACLVSSLPVHDLKDLNQSIVRAPAPHKEHANGFSKLLTKRVRFCGRTAAYIQDCKWKHADCKPKTCGRGWRVEVWIDESKEFSWKTVTLTYCRCRRGNKLKNRHTRYGNCQAGCHFEKSSKMHCDWKESEVARCYSARGWAYKAYKK